MSAQPQPQAARPQGTPDQPKTTFGEKLSAFLASFYPDLDEPIHLRTFRPKDAPEGFTWPNKLPVTRKGLEVDQSLADKLVEWNKRAGVYFVVNAGGDEDKDITRYTAWFAEDDERSVEGQLKRLAAAPLRPSILVVTRKSVHAYWLATPGCAEAEWRDIQLRLISYFDSDDSIKNPSRVMRVPYLNHITYEKIDGSLSFHKIELVEFAPDRSYTVEQMQAAFPPPPEPEVKAKQDSQSNHTGDTGEYRTWEALNAALRQRVMDRARRNGRGNYEMACPAHDGRGDTSLFYNPTTGVVKCLAGCLHADLLLTHGLPAFPINQPRIHFGSQQTPPPEAFEPQDAGEDEPAEELRCTDMGNGYRFARRHRLNVRYNYVSGKWYVFDGRRWLEDNSGEVYRLAKETAINILIEAAHTENEDRRKALAKWASVSEGDSKLRAMLHMAESELPVKLDVFDADPMLFNCANGTIDLRTGSLRPHRREDMLTKLSPVAYDVEAQPGRWLAFLDRVFAGDQQLIKFIQKAVGYSLAGDTSEQCLFICHGVGANGKSVLLKTIGVLTADYGQQVRTETLMIRPYATVSNDIAILRGARFISATETDDGQKLAESTVKQLTGGDAVRARFLFQESFQFTPQFKIWLAANHKPEIRGNDHAIWRRIRLVPFNVIIPKAEQNPHFFESELEEELPGILAWAVEGCLRWQREGLGEPEAVTKATADYREEQDAIAGFLSEKCVVGEHYQVTAKEIYYAYKTWCISNGEEALSAKWLGLQLRARGFLPDQDRKNRFYRGIGLIRDSNDDEIDF